MKVPYQLRKAAEAAPAAGLLLLSESVADLLALCAAAGAIRPGHPEAEADALPPVHAVPGGFLVKLARPAERVFPGALRLRRLAADLFLPADAELMPALLDEEAAGLVRQRGLVFLPGRVLAYDLTPLPAAALLTAPRLPDRGWGRLPESPPRAERLREILLDLPEESPDAILDTGGEAIGEEAPRPPVAGPGATAAGKAAAGAGRGLMWLGNALGWKGLAQAGAGLFAWAAALAPRLTEAVLGQQEAALRELLRRFRAGEIEEALRRALPLGGGADRGGAPAGDARLPFHNPAYRLSDLLLGSRGGPVAWWLGGADVQRELAAEYRKAAQAATARGDYRRAAFIYGKLLNDYRLAADVLSRGGLHHDAAVLYLEKLGDTLAAARAFEAAGEVDRALHLYRQRGEHALAGDLLRRAGEEEAAFQEYRQAADQLHSAGNLLAAGELMRERARRPDWALTYFAAGWARRPDGGALPCLMRMLTHYANEKPPLASRALLILTEEAEEFFAPPGNETGAGQFFNELARLADRPNLAEQRDDLRDRALAGLAGKLRERAAEEVRPGTAVSRLLGQSGAWAPAVVSDADYAFKAALRRPPRPAAGDARVSSLRLGRGEVTAACAAANGRLFVGFDNGEVVFFDPAEGGAHTLPAGDMPVWPVAALATDAAGHSLVVLHARGRGDRRLAAYAEEVGGFSLRKWREAGPETAWLTPIARPHWPTLAAGEGAALTLLDFPTLIPGERIDCPRPEVGLNAAVLLEDDPRVRGPGQVRSELLFAGNEVCHFPYRSAGEPEGADLGWAPGALAGALEAAPPVSWLRTAVSRVELAGVGGNGTAYWTRLVFDGGAPQALTLPSVASNYLAAALVRQGLVAAVSAGGVEWLRAEGRRLLGRGAAPLAAATALACFPSRPTGELLVVCRGGLVLRVPLPS